MITQSPEFSTVAFLLLPFLSIGFLAMHHRVHILDGPMGTELARRGVPTPLPAWSALANGDAPHVVAAIHRDYAEAGATIHTANTFRTKARQVGDRWRELSAQAIAIARGVLPQGHVVVASIAPLEDCYSPWLSPAEDDPLACKAEHAEFASWLAAQGVDCLLVETMPHPLEALLALEAAVSTGLPSWLALTPGPDGSLLSPVELAQCAEEGVRRGAQAIFVNCVAFDRALPYVEALSEVGARHNVPIGVYANAGHPDQSVGWQALDTDPELAATLYLQHATEWISAGASIVGGCCGTGVPHIRKLSQALSRGEQSPP
ncbi:MAG: homocysteine S-methyltransferase family protein [Deltaproteobacteria bacterium]|nr:homocysteine S-methyltransferase family protein [Deltaproteobacteria bacterium]